MKYLIVYWEYDDVEVFFLGERWFFAITRDGEWETNLQWVNTDFGNGRNVADFAMVDLFLRETKQFR